MNLPTLRVVPGVGACREPSSDYVSRADLAAQPPDHLNHIWLRYTAKYPRCPRPGRPEPQEVAIDVLERTPLPAPRPHIAPGFAITGKPGFLEPNLDAPVVNGRPTVVESRATELGPMAISATAVYRVQWGDGETGPHKGPGGPWPNGNITHTWTTIGYYDVVVTAEWTVEWQMGGATGRLTVPTTGTLEDFQVDQLQAVINR